MRKILLILCMIPLLTGCTFMHAHIITGKAKGFKGVAVPYAADLDSGNVVWYEILFLTTERVTRTFLNNLPFQYKEK